MQSLPDLVGKEKISGNETLEETPINYVGKDLGYKNFLSYMASVQKKFGSDDPFMPYYRISGDATHA